MPRTVFLTLSSLFLFPFLSIGQDYLPADGIVITKDTPQVRKVSIVAYGSDYVQFQNIDGTGKLIRLNANQFQSFTLLNNKSRFEPWKIQGNRLAILQVQGKAGQLKLAHTLNPKAKEWFLQRDSLVAQNIRPDNYQTRFDSLSNDQPFTRAALPHVRFKRNSMLRFLNYSNQGQKGLFSYLRIGPTAGFNAENVHLNRIMGRNFRENATSTAYSQRYHIGVQADIPFGVSNRLSLVSSLLFVADDQAFTGPRQFDDVRNGFSIQSYYLELPLMASIQLPPLSARNHWYPFVRTGLTLRQRIKTDALRYRIVALSDDVVDARYVSVEQEYKSDFGLTAAAAIAHPLLKNAVLEINLRYLYFLQRDLFTGRLRLSASLKFGK